MKKTYEITAATTVFNRERAEQRTFEVGERVTGEMITIDGVQSLNVDGYPIPPEYVKQVSTPIWMLAGIGVAFLVVAFVLVKLFRK